MVNGEESQSHFEKKKQLRVSNTVVNLKDRRVSFTFLKESFEQIGDNNE